MASVSAVIIAQDEERTIGKVLSAVKDFVSEIILVDSGSSDKTIEIARGHGAKVLHQDWLGYSAQKNFALAQASCDWILSLDADEIVTPELAAEIKQVLSGDLSESFDGFKIARLLFVGEHAIAHGGFYPDAQLRLFKRGMGKFNDRLVHESVALDGRVGKLKHHMLHLSYRNVEQFKAAHEKYARLAAKESMRSGFNPAKATLLNLYLHPIWTFLYRYFGRAGFLDGLIGLQMNLAYSQYVRKKIVYLREAARQP
ncbi:MAG: glycosyltransferase family 2 protein [Candidatus Obscuribacterales bacterium]|nr:glycosyltransferase family 2 protein [Candidatus Obscuribacterales bacterium]